jgi:type VI secretion system protein ImpH
MADSKRQTTDPLIDRLRGQQAAGYDFFRLVRLLQAAHPAFPPVGQSKTPQDDPIRFGQRPSLAFAPGAIDRLDPGPPLKLIVNFFGLLGPNGPLPLHLTQLAVRRQAPSTTRAHPPASERTPPSTTTSASSPLDDDVSRENHVLRDFLDIFHHRLLSLFFRAWAACQPSLDHDRGGKERFLSFITSVWGASALDLDVNDAGDPDHIPARSKAYYSGWLSSPARNAEGLEAILRDYFAVPTTLEEFKGRWFDLPHNERLVLRPNGAGAVLGKNTIIGSRMWAVHLSFRITMGPMGFGAFERLLPGGPGFHRLQSWILTYLGTELLWDLRLLLEAPEVPDTLLGRSGRLGWTTWLKGGRTARAPGELILAGDHEEKVTATARGDEHHG